MVWSQRFFYGLVGTFVQLASSAKAWSINRCDVATFEYCLESVGLKIRLSSVTLVLVFTDELSLSIPGFSNDSGIPGETGLCTRGCAIELVRGAHAADHSPSAPLLKPEVNEPSSPPDDGAPPGAVVGITIVRENSDVLCSALVAVAAMNQPLGRDDLCV